MNDLCWRWRLLMLSNEIKKNEHKFIKNKQSITPDVVVVKVVCIYHVLLLLLLYVTYVL